MVHNFRDVTLASTVIDETTKLPRRLRHVPMEGWRALRELSAQARVEVLEKVSRELEEAWEREPDSKHESTEDAQSGRSPEAP